MTKTATYELSENFDLKKQNDSIKKDQESTPGIRVFAGEIETSDYDDVDYPTLMKDYTDMRNGNPIVSTTVDILKLPILSSQIQFETTDNDVSKEAADFLQWQFDNLKDGLQSFKYHSLLCLDYGHIMFEKVFSRGVKYGGKTTSIITRLPPIQFHAIFGFSYDEQMDFSGITHTRIGLDGRIERIEIPLEKLFIIVHNQEFGDVRGRSILRTTRKYDKYKSAILESTTRAIQRGAGLPIITKFPGVGDDDITKANIKILGQTMGNAKNAYVVEEKEKIEVRLQPFQHQENNLAILQYLDTQSFFNTLSQFMVAGIGQGANGSRSAAGELKASYELSANYILTEIEDRFQKLANEMIQISHLANMPVDDRPKLSFTSITKMDLTKLSSAINGFITSGAINATPEDEKFLRQFIGLPEMKEIGINISGDQAVADDNTDEITGGKLSLESGKKRELTEFEKNVFEFQSAIDHYDNTRQKAEAIVNDVSKKILADVADQLKTSRKKQINIRYTRELFTRLKKLYDEGKAKGKTDVKKEITKISNKPTALKIELADSLFSRDDIKLQKYVDYYSNKLKSVVEDTMDNVTDAYIENNGGIDSILMTIFSESMKQQQRDLFTAAEMGYVDGRGQELMNNPDIEEFYYSTHLDGNLCVECAKLDGLIMTKEEIDKSGLRFDSPINPDCMGGKRRGHPNNCRCQIIPFKLRSE